MEFFIKTRSNSKEEKIEKADNSHFVVYVKEPAREGRANAAVLRVIADYFEIPQSQVSFVSGRKSKNKIVKVIL